MQDWIVTLPKGVPWKTYRKEIEAVSDGYKIMRYRAPGKPTAKVGERMFVLWNNKVRGWMRIVDVQRIMHTWTCSTTGTLWPEGWYIGRSGEWHPVTGPKMQGFRGVRRYDGGI